MKIDNVKATKLQYNDRIVIGGTKFKITFLSRTFGRGRDRVNLSLHPAGDKKGALHCNMGVPATARFTVTRKNK